MTPMSTEPGYLARSYEAKMKRNDDLGDESAPHLLFSFGGGDLNTANLTFHKDTKRRNRRTNWAPCGAWPGPQEP